jgi:pyruvate, water dikinase
MKNIDVSKKRNSVYVLPFKEIDKHDVELVGGKGANLGEMARSGFPVPDGFSVTVSSYDKFLKDNDLEEKLYDILNKTDTNNPEELKSASERTQKLIKSSKIPEDVKKDIISSYKKLTGLFSKTYVAARSSATAEDMPGTSFAGQQATFLNILGDANLLQAVKDCWASLYTPRSIFYRVENKITHEKVKISVVVQKMIRSEVSGVMFSIDPITSDKDRIIIEAVWGLGEMIVQGSVIPDRYAVQKDTFSILSKEISEQRIQLIRKGEKTLETSVPASIIEKQKISDEEVQTLAKLADKLHKHYFFPQDIEWAKEKGKLYIVQTRPVTSFSKKNVGQTKKMDEKTLQVSDTPILTGISASPGIGTGVVKILKSAKEISKIKSGDVLVAPMTSPDYVPAMKKAVAIITNEGGQTSHAAIVSRELGVPCVVGTKTATETLKDDQVVSVDGSKGLVFMGSRVIKEETKTVEKEFTGKTATKIYVNLAEPERSREISKLNVDGVGLLRAEFMIANIGIHPKEAIKRKVQQKFIDNLYKGISKFCESFYPRPVVYRATDFKTNEYRMLDGGKKWEPVESNPMLGYRGAFRYIADPEVFALELRALKEVQKKYKNIYLMIPFVRSPEELKKIRRLVIAEGLFEEPNFKFWMMVEIPVNVIMLEEFIKVGIDGVSIGSNDLTMLITGTDRDNSEVAREFDERSPAVYWALRKTIKTCNKYGVTSSICGQAPSSYDDFVEKMIEYGVTSMSINPDSVSRVRSLVSDLEKKYITKK